jgi:hypothetical protein
MLLYFKDDDTLSVVKIDSFGKVDPKATHVDYTDKKRTYRGKILLKGTKHECTEKMAKVASKTTTLKTSDEEDSGAGSSPLSLESDSDSDSDAESERSAKCSSGKQPAMSRQPRSSASSSSSHSPSFSGADSRSPFSNRSKSSSEKQPSMSQKLLSYVHSNSQGGDSRSRSPFPNKAKSSEKQSPMQPPSMVDKLLASINLNSQGGDRSPFSNRSKSSTGSSSIAHKPLSSINSNIHRVSPLSNKLSKKTPLTNLTTTSSTASPQKRARVSLGHTSDKSAKRLHFDELKAAGLCDNSSDEDEGETKGEDEYEERASEDHVNDQENQYALYDLFDDESTDGVRCQDRTARGRGQPPRDYTSGSVFTRSGLAVIAGEATLESVKIL